MEPLSVRDPREGDRQIAQLVYPTHQCFEDATELLVYFLTEEHVPPGRLLLVHAICLMPDTTQRFAHAWLEKDGECLFLGIYQGERVICFCARPEYYRRMRVQERTKYTPSQAAREGSRLGYGGPWKPAYLALLKQPDALQLRQNQS